MYIKSSRCTPYTYTVLYVSYISVKLRGKELMQMQKKPKKQKYGEEAVVYIIYQKENIGPWKVCFLQNTY